ncbi:MAG: hypothetical protein DI538_02265 [Azospira oryzae]|jgi:hypothetical protein|nr:MAG: hypothetical protein DI538_02265 [Azospira oryzae]
MKKVITLPLSLLFVFLLTGFQSRPMKEYCNERYAFCVPYPDAFTGQGESGNGDGQTFLSKDKQAEILAYGEMAIEEISENLTDVYQNAASHLNVSYKVVKPDWFVISGLNKEGKIVYRKTVKKKIHYAGDENEDTFIYQTLMITYPQSQQRIYGSYCGLISKSLSK